MRERTHAPRSPAEQHEHEHVTTALRRHAEETIIASAWAQGRAMSLDAAVAYALVEPR